MAARSLPSLQLGQFSLGSFRVPRHRTQVRAPVLRRRPWRFLQVLQS